MVSARLLLERSHLWLCQKHYMLFFSCSKGLFNPGPIESSFNCFIRPVTYLYGVPFLSDPKYAPPALVAQYCLNPQYALDDKNRHRQ